MNIYPAIDLLSGKVVRLERGNYEKVKVYGNDPKTVAERWRDEGATWLHVVDLEGARSGSIHEWESLSAIASVPGVSVQFGGGIRQFESIVRLLKMGIARVVIGTKALDRAFLGEISKRFGKQIALSLDLKGDEVCVEGWKKGGGVSLYEFLEGLKGLPISCLVVTDIERDGTLKGINIKKVEKILKASPLPVILSGGVSSPADLKAIQSLTSKQLEGAIIGKALYEGKIQLPEILRMSREKGEETTHG